LALFLRIFIGIAGDILRTRESSNVTAVSMALITSTTAGKNATLQLQHITHTQRRISRIICIYAAVNKCENDAMKGELKRAIKQLSDISPLIIEIKQYVSNYLLIISFANNVYLRTHTHKLKEQNSGGDF